MSAAPAFQAIYGRAPTHRADAPGRVNLIGEHTDYNGGFVLPIAIPQRTQVELARRDDELVRATSHELEPGRVREYRLGAERPAGDWLDYLQGVTAILRGEGHGLGGFEARIESDVPLGSGLASSAALEVALLRVLRDAAGLAIDDVTLARLGQRVENEFVGARVGIMDQLAASLADQRRALFVDTRSLAYERVPLPPDVELVVINSGVSHSNVSGEYNTRRAECEAACRVLGVAELRDVVPADLPRVEALPEPLNRRARHVVTENARVLDAVAAMRTGDAERLGRLFYASHASMRDDYEVSIPEIDLLVDLARADPDVVGARLTGGGFGGSVVILAGAGTGRRVGAEVARAYAERSGRDPAVLVPMPTEAP
ncbi:MAG: galactokinase [Chloroflexota bacterium]|nr:galactokinase [Chloroflexota bacterium]